MNFLMNTGRQQTHRFDSTDLARCPKHLRLHDPGIEIIVMQAQDITLVFRAGGKMNLRRPGFCPHQELGN